MAVLLKNVGSFRRRTTFVCFSIFFVTTIFIMIWVFFDRKIPRHTYVPVQRSTDASLHLANVKNATASLSPYLSPNPPLAPTIVTETRYIAVNNHSPNSSTILPTIFVITPTYTRDMQKVELTRQCQTFSLVQKLHWIVIEDSDTQTELVSKLLHHCPVKSTLLNRKTSTKLKHTATDVKHKNRGAQQRNIGLEWLRHTYRPKDIKGVVYFADDDNTYDIRLFDEMRFTKKISVWPVGFAGGVRAEGPKCNNGHVVGYHSGWASWRKFPLDMAAFAVNLDVLLRNPKVKLNTRGTSGYLETDFLTMIATQEELEPRANNCTEVYVWHTETKDPVLNYELKNPTLLEVKR